MTDQITAAQDLDTSAGGRAYVEEYFATELRRHDFARYIKTALAADFACALAQHLSKPRAPVAGEAQPVCWIERTQLEKVRDEGDDAWVYSREQGHVAEPDEVPLYAAPQVSGAVRIVFPAHLRKMWSGGEVQAWLDKHQGITPPKASAKGSMERYRAWQAEQADAKKDGAPCSCPSGDGSLRHPCAVHSPADRDRAALAIPPYGGPLCGPVYHHPLCRAALSTQPAKKPANPDQTPAGNPGNPGNTGISSDPLTGKNNDGGAVYG